MHVYECLTVLAFASCCKENGTKHLLHQTLAKSVWSSIRLSTWIWSTSCPIIIYYDYYIAILLSTLILCCLFLSTVGDFTQTERLQCRIHASCWKVSPHLHLHGRGWKTWHSKSDDVMIMVMIVWGVQSNIHQLGRSQITKHIKYDSNFEYLLRLLSVAEKENGSIEHISFK